MRVDGTKTSADQTLLTAATGYSAGSGSYSVACDINLDGTVDSTDQSLYTGYSGGTLGRGNMSRNIVRNRKGYAGYEHDGILDSIMHVRHRVYESELGRWVQRDPLGFVDGGSLYGYVKDAPNNAIDEMGLVENPIRNIPGHPGFPHPPGYDPFAPPQPIFPEYQCGNRMRDPTLPPASSNGCGSGQFSRLGATLSMYGGVFRNCCNTHDLCYSDCNSNRSTCDTQFYICMLFACFFKGATCEAAAWAFYQAVHYGGTQPYRDAQASCICCDRPNPHKNCPAQFFPPPACTVPSDYGTPINRPYQYFPDASPTLKQCPHDVILNPL